MRSVLLGFLLCGILVSPAASQVSQEPQTVLRSSSSNAAWSAISAAIAVKPWIKVGIVTPHENVSKLMFATGLSFPTGKKTSSSILYRTVHGRGPEWEFGISKALW